MATRPNIGRAELEVLQFVQDNHPVTVRQAADHVGKTKGVVRTTVLNVMSRLVKKGYLVRRKEAGVFVYSPKLAKAQMVRTMVGDFVDRALGGSLSPFMLYLAQDAKLSAGDVAQLKELVRTLDSQSQSSKPAKGKEEP